MAPISASSPATDIAIETMPWSDRGWQPPPAVEAPRRKSRFEASPEKMRVMGPLNLLNTVAIIVALVMSGPLMAVGIAALGTAILAVVLFWPPIGSGSRAS